MNNEDLRELATQERVIKILGRVHRYQYAGNLKQEENSNIREDDLMRYLTTKGGYADSAARQAVAQLKLAAKCMQKETLFKANQDFYALLRYGPKVDTPEQAQKITVLPIKWADPLDNDFAIAEEVTVRRDLDNGEHRRPDLVVYVNGIALCVIELKRAAVSVGEAIRQNFRNQEDGEICGFFSTVQLIMAGNDSEGLYYGTIRTPEKFWQRWKEPCGTPCPPPRYNDRQLCPFELDQSLLQMLEPKALLDFIYNCVLFDGGVKKVARPNQYFALKVAHSRIEKRENGIIWHSQGSGKSLTMVMLADWILENQQDARVVVITDRDELDEQITTGFANTGHTPVRALSGGHLLRLLNENKEPLICTLIHKFGLHSNVNEETEESSESSQWEGPAYRKHKPLHKLLTELAEHLPADFKAKGNFYVFVDECHRTQGGYLNRAMKMIMGEQVMLIGFTGTPLLKADKQRLSSRQNFGDYIHSYTFKEAAADHVVLDLHYTARHVDQLIESPDELDGYFNQIAASMSRAGRERLKQRWATLQNIHSSEDRIRRIVRDICKDMTIIPALSKGWGNAMLIADSIYAAFRYWKAFQDTSLRGHCAVVSSYKPGNEPPLGNAHSSEEELSEEEFKYNTAREMIGKNHPDVFEQRVKTFFVKQPSEMKLLIVVDKLLTGFDAPKATYLYIDKKFSDGPDLFQAICRVNRVSDERKLYGHIIDYRELFGHINQSVSDYTHGVFEAFDPKDVEDVLQSDTQAVRKELDKAIQAITRLCEPVSQPRGLDNFFDYFCYNHITVKAEQQAEELEKREPMRQAFYQAVMNLDNRYADAVLRMDELGYSKHEADEITTMVKRYDEFRHAIMLRSGDYIDMRKYDAQMRRLLDQFIDAPRSYKLEDMEDFSFLDFLDIDANGEVEGIDKTMEDEVGGRNGIAAMIVANTRSVINRKRLSNPGDFQRLSTKLNLLINQLQAEIISYTDFLKRMKELAEEIRQGNQRDPRLNTAGKQALFEVLGQDVELTLHVAEVIKAKAQVNWRTNRIRGNILKNAVGSLLPDDIDKDLVFKVIQNNPEF